MASHGGVEPEDESWVGQLAKWLINAMSKPLPNEVLHIAARETADSFACAIAALSDPAAIAMLKVVQVLGGAEDCVLFGSDLRVPPTSAVLYNGSLVRALACNDIFFASGPTGHPSD